MEEGADLEPLITNYFTNLFLSDGGKLMLINWQ